MMQRAVVPSLVAFLLAGPAAAQQVLKVPAQYKTIQAAIDAASHKDTVLVAPGTYPENIDFKGKAISVSGEYGATVTTLSGTGKQTGAVVTFASGEGKDSVLEGFTVTNGGPGIVITNSGPTVRFNHITGNQSVGNGGGLRISGTPTNYALIMHNEITENEVVSAPFNYQLSGGGLRCVRAILANNVIRRNRVIGADFASSPWQLGGGVWSQDSIIVNNLILFNWVQLGATVVGRPQSCGGGLHTASTDVVINNTIWGNAVGYGTLWGTFEGGGVYTNGARVVNCIIRENTAWTCHEISGTATFCNIKGGHPGIGNIDADPQFTADGTFHLAPDSPCRDTGSGGYLNFSASDFEWDDRGWGSGVDIGADEFAPHVYHFGETRRGKTFTLTVLGEPGKTAWLGYAAKPLQTPIPIPGSGLLWLDPWTLRLMPLGTLPPSGRAELLLSIPVSAPLVLVPFQALLGAELTRPELIQVVP
ncbi:MAG: hypothetical protein JXQ29_10235 [Planctomycetes bacterium]|nr:hypothetical protein [Planctomycetota bacterium]